MGNLSLGELGKYENWVNKSAKEILDSVKSVGGWVHVFPNELPLWAHRVRNYFNQEPTYLKRLTTELSSSLLTKIRRNLEWVQAARRVKVLKEFPVFNSHPKVKALHNPPPGTPDVEYYDAWIDEYVEDEALYRYVYSDYFKNTWYQMDAGGTIYHWGSDPYSAAAEAIYTSKVRGQDAVPIFKLVSPDGTGGSMETIIKNEPVRIVPVFGHNYKLGRWSIEEVGVVKHVIPIIETNPRYQGSYNYSETVVMGIGNHEKRDVNTHKRFAGMGIYLNPSNRYELPANRTFPEKATGENNPIANQLELKDIF